MRRIAPPENKLVIEVQKQQIQDHQAYLKMREGEAAAHDWARKYARDFRACSVRILDWMAREEASGTERLFLYREAVRRWMGHKYLRSSERGSEISMEDSLSSWLDSEGRAWFKRAVAGLRE